MKRICIAALAGLMLFAGCRGSLPGMEDSREKETAAPVKLTEVFENYQVYEQVEVPLPPDCKEGGTVGVLQSTEDGFAGTYRTDSGERWAEYDWEGNLLETADLPPYENLTALSTCLLLEDGAALLVNNYFPEDGFLLVGELCLVQKNGEVTARYPFSSYFAQPPQLLRNDDRILLMDYNTDTLWVFDHGLEMTGSFTLAYSPDTLSFGADGTLYCQAYDGLVYTISPENGYMEPVLQKPVGNETYRQYTGLGQDLYEYTAEGFFRVAKAEDGSFGDPELLLDWNTSGLAYERIDILAVPDPHTLLCMSGNNLDNRENLVLLHRLPDDQVPERKIVNLFLGAGMEMDVLQRLAAEFNLQNREYYVHVETTDFMRVSETEELIYSMLRDGDIPDLLYLNSYLDAMYMNLLKQGYLADLTDLAEPLTTSAEAAVRYGDVCGRIPLFIRYHTLLSAKVTEPLTAETLLACRENTDGALFSANMANELREVIQNVFIDPDTGECSFDSPLFRSYLELIRDAESLTDYRLGRLDESHGSGYQSFSLVNSSLPESLQTGSPLFLQIPLSTIGAWSVTKVIWGETDFAVCGYPGAMTLPVLDCSLAVLRDGACTDGAKAFLEFVLSDDVQTSAYLSQYVMPVTSSALEILLEKDWFQLFVNDAEPYRDALYRGYMDDAVIETDITSIQVNENSRTEPEITEGNRTVYGDRIRNIRLTEADKAQIRALLENENCGRMGDPTVDDILWEEISAFLSGDRTMEDTIRVLQSRVSTYLAEIQ